MQTKETMNNLGEVLYRSLVDFVRDNQTEWAAAIAYYSLLSIFPLILATVAIAAHFIDPGWVLIRITEQLGQFLPGGESQIAMVIQEVIETRGSVSLLSAVALLWSGSRAFAGITMALNIAYNANETYGFFRRTLVQLMMMLTIGLLFIIGLASQIMVSLLGIFFNLFSSEDRVILRVVGEIINVIFLFFALFLTYRFVPRKKINAIPALIGALLATLLFFAARPLFLHYVERFSNITVVYGSLAIVIILVVWAWVVAMIVLYGGEVASHYHGMVVEKHTVEEFLRRYRLVPFVHRSKAPQQGVPVISGEAQPYQTAFHASHTKASAKGRVPGFWFLMFTAIIAGLTWLFHLQKK